MTMSTLFDWIESDRISTERYWPMDRPHETHDNNGMSMSMSV